MSKWDRGKKMSKQSLCSASSHLIPVYSKKSSTSTGARVEVYLPATLVDLDLGLASVKDLSLSVTFVEPVIRSKSICRASRSKSMSLVTETSLNHCLYHQQCLCFDFLPLSFAIQWSKKTFMVKETKS